MSNGRLARLLVLSLSALIASGAHAVTEPKVDFNRDVRPLLSEYCFTCHGPDDAKRKSGLRLDQKESAYKPAKSGKTAIVPGNAAQSELIKRITTDDEDDQMPPVKTGKHLSPQQITLLQKWVSQGAPYRSHWAFEPPVRPAVPEVQDKSWPRNEIDRFILARLEKEGLKPSPEAPKATLIRRVYLDLTGLPPTQAEVDAFEHDTSPNAYEKIVDRCLASPRYGERMAMSWLDGARYADSHGYQADWERYQWRWRDWVINAFNTNEPFDQFTVEQLAGDLLPNPTIEQRVATGFNRNHRMNTEGGTIPEEWRTEYVIDRVDTMGQVWLGLTLGCCRCHDHKYDPITQKEFYQLYSFFNNNAESGKGAEKAGNHEPAIKAPRPFEVAKLKELDAAILAAETTVKEKEAKLPQLLAKWEAAPQARQPGVNWVVADPMSLKSATNTSALTRRPDKSVFATKRTASTDTGTDSYTINFQTGLPEITAIRLEALPDDALPGKGPGRADNGNFVLTNVEITIDGQPARIAKASADYSQNKHPVAHAIDADPVGTGWAVHPNEGVPHQAVFALETPVKSAEPMTVSVKLEFRSRFARHMLGHFRLSATDSKTPHDAGGTPAAIVKILDTPLEKRTEKQRQELTTYFRQHFAGDITEADRALAKAKSARSAFEESIPTVMVMQDLPQPREAHILIRGEYDKPGERVEPGLPRLFGALPDGAPMNRLGLAKWIVKPDNPLTARVAVNRFWEKFFGVGIVKTSENLGSQADWPSHPELLDWLATEFVRLGWDMKAIQKEMVMSAAYRQGAAVTPDLVERDPENRLLARGPRFRLQAEIIRDQAMAVAGLLVEKLGGPSVRPYQPDGIWDEINVYGNLRNYKHDTGDDLHRRSLYTIWKRTSAPPGMTIFDMPSREVCTVRRSRTNTPLQALALMNDVTYVEASRALAQRMLREGGPTPEDRIAWAFRTATARTPDADEVAILSRGLAQRIKRYQADPAAAKKLLAEGDAPLDKTLAPEELAAYTMTASIILNLDEVVTRE
jgi:mono/diheme cytochrome c family protein